MKQIKSLNQLSIAILGFGNEGKDTYHFLRQHFPQKELAILDRKEKTELTQSSQDLILKDKHITFHFGENYLDSLNNYDLVIKSPGIPLSLPQLKTFINAGKVITSQTQLFFDLFPGKIIGVTGTKGKSTTSSLINQILSSVKKDVILVGNIGQPALSALSRAQKSTVAVYELSSFQLQSLHSSPNIAVILAVYSEHQDYHQSTEEYVAAKTNICKYQTKKNIVVFNLDSSSSRKIAQLSPGEKYTFSIKSKTSANCYVENSTIKYRHLGKSEIIINSSQIPLKGKFNLNNVMAAILVAKSVSVPTHSIKKAIKDFKSLKHRLEYVGEFNHIKFYNDSLATTPIATTAAIKALSSQVYTLILGGSDRKPDYSELARTISQNQIKTLILFPDTGKRILNAVKKTHSNFESINYYFTDNMNDAVKLAFKHTLSGKICLLSPAAPSFNMFKNYAERGDAFIKSIHKFTTHDRNQK